MTTLLRPIDEIALVGVYGAGVPNQERIVYQVHQPVDLGEYAVCLAVELPDGNVVPFRDRMLWLGAERAEPGQWIFIYTGAGERRLTKTQNGEPAVVIHWEQRETVFIDPQIVPVVFHLNGILTRRTARTLSEAREQMSQPSLTPEIISAFLKSLAAGAETSSGGPSRSTLNEQMLRAAVAASAKNPPTK